MKIINYLLLYSRINDITSFSSRFAKASKILFLVSCLEFGLSSWIDSNFDSDIDSLFSSLFSLSFEIPKIYFFFN